MKRLISWLAILINAVFSVQAIHAANGIAVPGDVGLPNRTLIEVVSDFTMWLLAIFGFLAIISFVVTGIMYLTATGDEDQQKKAKRQMTWSIVGVIIGLSGYIVIRAVDAWLKGTTQTF